MDQLQAGMVHGRMAEAGHESRVAPLLPQTEADAPSRGPSSTSGLAGQHRQLGILSVTMIIFFNVSGGPLGSEQIVSSVGPLPGLCSMVVFALCYSVPQAMITAELSTAFPDNGGYSLWVQAAFGDFWGLQESYWSWFSGVVDSALYPVLLYSSAAQLLAYRGHDPTHAAGWPAVTGGNHSHQTCPAYDDDDSSGELWRCLDASSCVVEYLTKLAILCVFALPNLISPKAVSGVAA